MTIYITLHHIVQRSVYLAALPGSHLSAIECMQIRSLVIQIAQRNLEWLQKCSEIRVSNHRNRQILFAPYFWSSYAVFQNLNHNLLNCLRDVKSTYRVCFLSADANNDRSSERTEIVEQTEK